MNAFKWPTHARPVNNLTTYQDKGTKAYEVGMHSSKDTARTNTNFATEQAATKGLNLNSRRSGMVIGALAGPRLKPQLQQSTVCVL